MSDFIGPKVSRTGAKDKIYRVWLLERQNILEVAMASLRARFDAGEQTPGICLALHLFREELRVVREVLADVD